MPGLGRSRTREGQGLKGQTQRVKAVEGSQIWPTDHKSRGLAADDRWQPSQVGDIWEG